MGKFNEEAMFKSIEAVGAGNFSMIFSELEAIISKHDNNLSNDSWDLLGTGFTLLSEPQIAQSLPLLAALCESVFDSCRLPEQSMLHHQA